MKNTEEIDLSIDKKEEVVSEINDSADIISTSSEFTGTPEERIAALISYIDQSQERYVECSIVRKFFVLHRFKS